MDPSKPITAADPKHHPLISLEGISKRFGSLWANQDISMEIHGGEVHAIVGENGAGKSTLMRILYGDLLADSGRFLLEGKPVRFLNPKDAMEAGFGMVHQQLQIFPQLSALENVILGAEPKSWGCVDWKRAKERVQEFCGIFGFQIAQDVPAGELSFATRQQIEILRAVYHDARILLLDEPTSLLSPPEVRRFLHLLASLKGSGHTVLFISHRLEEVLTVADRISVLCRGRSQGTYTATEVTEADLVRIIVCGAQAEPRTVAALHCERGNAPEMGGESLQTPVLEMRNVCTAPLEQQVGLQDFSLEIGRGEIVGIGGIVGNGEGSLGRLIAGLVQPERGKILLHGKDISSHSISRRKDMGLWWLPTNLPEEAFVPERPIWENLLMGRQRKAAYQTAGWLRKRRIRDWVVKQAADGEVVYSNLEEPLGSLSGGNQQKLALSRVLANFPLLAVLEQPGRGLDIKGQERLRNRLDHLSDQGSSFMVISYDLEELLSLCHRIGILFRGRLMGSVSRAEATLEDLGRWMVGVA